MNKSPGNGFTLIELMVVVLVAAILAGFAVPSYQNYVLRSGRTDATVALLKLAAAQEKFYLQNGVYANDAQLETAPPAGLGVTGGKTERGYYKLSIAPDSAGLAVGFTITATAIGTEKQGADTDCLTLSIDQNGRRGANAGHSAAVVEKCWR